VEVTNGTDPAESDSDHDGIDDGGDNYPTDERRSEDLPVITYAAIEVSKGISDAVKGIALGDSGKLAFWYDAPSGTDFGVAVARNGEVKAEDKHSYPKTFNNGTDTWI
jgi:hypothetical protein